MTETQQTPAIDKSAWGDGPWQSEPDRVDFVHAGFACLALRHPRHGNWCGYVAVPREHPLYGKAYGDVDLEIHGGVNYADKCSGRICHVPAPGMPDDVWWFGGDFGHAFDLSPGMDAHMREIGDKLRAAGLATKAALFEQSEIDRRQVYRALPYVRREIKRLAAQLAQLR